LSIEYGLHIDTVHSIIKTHRKVRKEKPGRVIFKGVIYSSPESLAKKLGIKKESVLRSIKRGTKYEKRYQIKYYKKAI
jgi:hypothetical protein